MLGLPAESVLALWGTKLNTPQRQFLDRVRSLSDSVDGARQVIEMAGVSASSGVELYGRLMTWMLEQFDSFEQVWEVR